LVGTVSLLLRACSSAEYCRPDDRNV
jgi:hypothetical protein